MDKSRCGGSSILGGAGQRVFHLGEQFFLSGVGQSAFHWVLRSALPISAIKPVQTKATLIAARNLTRFLGVSSNHPLMTGTADLSQVLVRFLTHGFRPEYSDDK